MAILAIESTCDETGASVAQKTRQGVEILSNSVASSATIHQKYGGVVPEVAAREQVKSIIPVIEESLSEAKIQPHDLEAIAVTVGPGLIGSLLIGVETAKTLSLAWNRPLLGVNHMVAHLFANWIVEDEAQLVPEFPTVALIVSGGHTDLLLLKNLHEWIWLGGTRDDAAGECMDKCARILGLPYPGGPNIQASADTVTLKDKKIVLPRPLIHETGYDFSFSGLKTATSKLVQECPTSDFTAQIALELNQAIVDVLVSKTRLAILEFAPKSVVLAGGVSANKLLREKLKQELEKLGVSLFVPRLKYCTDNAAMVAAAALMRPQEVNPLEVSPIPGLEVI